MRPVFHEALRLEIKAADLGKRHFRGVATTINADHAGDIVEPRGAEFSLPLPLLRLHRQAEPIGEVYQAAATDDGIEIEARGPDKTPLDYVNEAWEQIRARLVKGLSVGFQPLEYEAIRDRRTPFQAVAVARAICRYDSHESRRRAFPTLARARRPYGRP